MPTSPRPESETPQAGHRRALYTVAGLLAVAGIVVLAMLVWPSADQDAPSPGSSEGPGPEGEPDGDAEPTPGGEYPESPVPPEPALPADGVVTVADLGVSVVVTGASGQVEIVAPDADRRTLTTGLPDPTRLRLAPDVLGGIVWQEVDNTADVRRVDGDGHVSVLATRTEGESLVFVGVDHETGGALVVRTLGTEPDDMTGDLVSQPLEGGPHTVLRPGITGWESGLTFAAHGADVLLHGLYHEAFEGAFVWPDTAADPTTLFEGGELTGEYVRGVTMTVERATGVVLIETAAGFPEMPTARLMVVDLTNLTVTAEVEVPLDLGLEDTWLVPRDVSVSGGLLLVNRHAEGTWFAPLVHDLDSGHWAVLDGIEGRAVFAGG